MQGSHDNMGLISISKYAWLVEHLANREAIDEAIREHSLPKTQIDLPTAPASNFSAPSTVNEAEAWERAETWRRSMVEGFSRLLQAHTFAPA